MPGVEYGELLPSKIGAQGETGDVRPINPQGLHKRGHVVREEFRGMDSFRFVRFTRASWIAGDTSEVLGVLCTSLHKTFVLRPRRR